MQNGLFGADFPNDHQAGNCANNGGYTRDGGYRR
jgi:hypothetical protein